VTVDSVDAVALDWEDDPDRPGLHQVFAALSNPDRLAILAELRPTCDDPHPARTVTALARVIGVSRFAASRHLRQLCDAGLLEMNRCGKAMLHRLALPGLAQVEDWLYPIVDSLEGARGEDSDLPMS